MSNNTVNTKTYWTNYNNKTKVKIEELKEKIKPLELLKKLTIKKLTEDNNRVYYYFNINVNDVKDSIIQKLSPRNSQNSFSIVPKGYLSKSELLVELEKLKKLNKRLDILYDEVNSLKDSLISYDLYRYIIKKFNLEIVDEIIKGYSFNPGYGISTIRIQKKERDLSKPVINWNATIQAKQELIKNGKTPYKVLERDEKGVIKKDNGGEQYFIYIIDDYSYWWYWNKKKSNLPNELIYSFTPVRGDNCIIRKLHNYREKNPAITSIYKK